MQKPVLVLSSNDGCVIARSKEVKELGVEMGVPYFKVKDDLQKQGVTIFSSNITLYRDISKRVMETLASFAVPFEPYSIDEAFFILDEYDEVGARTFAQRIRERVETWTGVPVSIGVGQSQLIAKYAGSRAKQEDGVFLIAGGDAWREEMKQIHVGALWGVGRKTTQKCVDHGFTSAYDLAHADPAVLKNLLGIEGARMQAALNGVSSYTTENVSDQKSIMSSRSFGETTTKKSVLLDALSYHTTHAAEKMRAMEMATTRMSIHIRPRRHGTHALRGGHREILFPTPVHDTRTLITEVRHALEDLYEEHVPYIKAGVTLGGFVPVRYTQHTLFGSADTEESRALTRTIDALNARFGALSVRPGTISHKRTWRPRSVARSKAYTTKWSEILTVTS